MEILLKIKRCSFSTMTIEYTKINYTLSFLSIWINQRNKLMTYSVLIIWPNNSSMTAPSVSHSVPNVAKVRDDWIILNLSNERKNCLIGAARFIYVKIKLIFLILLLFHPRHIHGLSCGNSSYFNTVVTSGPFNCVAPLNLEVSLRMHFLIHYKINKFHLFLFPIWILSQSALLVLSCSSIRIASIFFNLAFKREFFVRRNFIVKNKNLFLEELNELVKDCFKGSNESLVLMV